MEKHDYNGYYASELIPFPSTRMAGINGANEAPNHQNVPATNNAQSAAFSMDSSRKHPMVETASNLPVYPQRPGEMYCDNYMLTRTCKFREWCIFDHPLWVPEGGIQDYKEGGEHSTIIHPCSQGSTPLPPLSSMPSGWPSPVAYGGPCVKSSGQPVLREPPQGTVPCDYPSVSLYERCKDRDCSCYTTKSFSFGSELNQPMVSFAPAQVHYSKELPIRPGKEDCLGYINNGSCMYGTNCQFNHPKTANPPPAVASENTMIQPMIPYGECNEIFGSNCHFNHHEKNSIHVPTAAALPNAMIQSELPFGKYNNHPTDEVFNLPSLDLQNMDLDSAIASLDEEQAIHPQRPGEINCNGKEDCLGYINNGSCMYGTNCQFNHPKTANPPPAVASENTMIQPMIPYGECNEICGSNCHFNHHEKNSIHVPTAAALPNAMIQSELPFGKYNNHPTDDVFNLPSLDLQNMDLDSAITSLDEEQAIHPQRPGEINCNLYMKTGHCTFGERCEFQHPNDWLPPRAVTENQALQPSNDWLPPRAVTENQALQPSNDWLPPRAVTENQALQPNVKHSLVVLPRREKTVACEYYMNTSLCMFGFACPFDHPSPREVLAMARAQEGAAGSVTETQTARFVLHGIVACDYYMNTGVCEYGFACKRYHPPPNEVLAVAKAQESAAGSVTKRRQRPQ